jgi:hypothetical protein
VLLRCLIVLFVRFCRSLGKSGLHIPKRSCTETNCYCYLWLSPLLNNLWMISFSVKVHFIQISLKLNLWLIKASFSVGIYDILTSALPRIRNTGRMDFSACCDCTSSYFYSGIPSEKKTRPSVPRLVAFSSLISQAQVNSSMHQR